MEAPLAERIRPQRLEDYISQLHLVGDNGSLTQQIARGVIPSMIFLGFARNRKNDFGPNHSQAKQSSVL